MLKFHPDKQWPITVEHQASETQANITRLIEKHHVTSVIEVGSFMGCSALMFAQHESVDTVICVDPGRIDLAKQIPDDYGTMIDFWPNGWGVPKIYMGIFVDNLREAGVWYKIVPIRGASVEVVDMLPEVDLVYIDGDHTYVGCSDDINLYLPKAKKVMCGDDFQYRSGHRPVNYHPGMSASIVPSSTPGSVPCYPGVVDAVNRLLPQRHVEGRFWWWER